MLAAYAPSTSQIPPASIEYGEVFYTNNQSVTFITKDGFGLFTMKISPYENSFELTIKFPEGTPTSSDTGMKTTKAPTSSKLQQTKRPCPMKSTSSFSSHKT